MADIQLEHGYTRLANELFEALLIFNFGHAELKTCLAIIRLTYGWGEKKRQLSLSQISKIAGLHRITVAKTIKKLVDKNVLGKQKTIGKMNVNILWINKDYSIWRVSPCANTNVSHTTNTDVSQVANHIKKERNKEIIENYKNKFLEEHAIN